jgi:uncharacterized protein
MKIILLLLLSFAIQASTLAQSQSSAATISVVGEAEILVVPDEAVFSFIVETVDQDSQKSKSLNDEQTQKLIMLAKELKIPAINIQSGYIRATKATKYDEYKREHLFIGYKISRDVTVTLTDLSKFETLISEAIKAGITELDKIELRSMKATELQRKAKLMAIKSAQEKAKALANEIGQNIGRAISVEENFIRSVFSNYSLGRDFLPSNANGRMIINSPPSELTDNFAPGRIIIRASIKATFELK